MTNDPPSTESGSPHKFEVIDTLARWFGVRESIRPLDYAICGVSLMLLKYAVEAGLIWTLAHRAFYPWDFLNPLMSAREALIQERPSGYPGRCSCGRCHFSGSRSR